jgi:hypothetical protein
MKLCMLFDLELNATDLSETLNAVFKRVKLRFKSLLDLDTEESKIPCKVDINELHLGAAAEEVAQDVKNRLLLLLEIRPSYNYLSEVTRISRPKKAMATIVEQDEDMQSQLSGVREAFISQHDSEEFDDDMMDDLPPL